MGAYDFETSDAYAKRLKAMRENAVDPLLPNYGKPGKSSAYATYLGGVATEVPPSAVTPQPQPMQAQTPPPVAPVAQTPPVENPVQTPPQPTVVQPDGQPAAQMPEPTPAPVAAPASFEERTRLARVKMGLELPSATDPTDLQLVSLERRIRNIGPRNRRERQRLEVEYDTLKKSLQPRQVSDAVEVAKIYADARKETTTATLAQKEAASRRVEQSKEEDRTLRQTLATQSQQAAADRIRMTGREVGTEERAQIVAEEEAKSLRKYAQQKELLAVKAAADGQRDLANDERELARDAELQANKLEQMQKQAQLDNSKAPVTTVLRDAQGNEMGSKTVSQGRQVQPNITGKAEVETYENPKNAEETLLKGAPNDIRAKYKPEDVREAKTVAQQVTPEAAKANFDLHKADPTKGWDVITYLDYLKAVDLANGNWTGVSVADSTIESEQKKAEIARYKAAIGIK